MIYLDTHAAAWLYAGLIDQFDPKLLPAIDEAALRVSPMVELELQYLKEIGRTSEGGKTVLSDLETKLSVQVCDEPFAHVIAIALGQTWTRDPFDRIIVAQAALTNSSLLTKDQAIRRHYPLAFWTEEEFSAATTLFGRD